MGETKSSKNRQIAWYRLYNIADELPKFQLSHGWVVDGISLRNGHIGGKGGDTSTITIAAGERVEVIKGIYVRFEEQLWIGEIAITTSKGQVISAGKNPRFPEMVISDFVDNRQSGQTISATAGERFVKELCFNV